MPQSPDTTIPAAPSRIIDDSSKPTPEELEQLRRILSNPVEREKQVEMIGFVLQRVEDGRMQQREAKQHLAKVGLDSVEVLNSKGIRSYSNQELLELILLSE